MKKIIIWDSDEIFFNDDEAEIKEMDEDDDDIDDDEAEITNEEGRKIRVKMPKSQRVVHTNFGTFLENNPTNPYNSRDIYIAHTNFDVTEDHIKTIIETAGVEGFRPITRYSFVVAIGIAFYFADVLDEINKKLEVERQDDYYTQQTKAVLFDNQDLVNGIIKEIKETFWYTYVFPNGMSITEEYKTQEEMEEKTEYFNALCSLSEGLLLSSHDKKKE